MPKKRLTKESARAGHAMFVAELESKPEFTIISSLISCSTTMVTEAVQKLLELTAAAARTAIDSADDGVLGNHLYYTSCSVLEVAMRTPPTKQHKLVQLIQQLLSITLIAPQGNGSLKHDERLVWKDLPTFGYTLADEMHKYSPTDPENTLIEQGQWENNTAFIAQLTCACKHTDFAGWSLNAFNEIHEIAADPAAPGTSLEHSVRAACLWILYAGEKIWTDVKSERRLELTSPDEDPDFDISTWEEWKTSLTDIQAKISDGGTNRMVNHALIAMHKLEGKAVAPEGLREQL